MAYGITDTAVYHGIPNVTCRPSRYILRGVYLRRCPSLFDLGIFRETCHHLADMPGKTAATPRITKFTNCRLVRGSSLIEQDLWIDSLTGKILKDQEAFYELHLSPDEIIDLGGRIIAPGMIDVQLNGAHGFDFSVPAESKEEYDEGLRMVNKGLARTGVTSYLPTVVSSTAEVYHKVNSMGRGRTIL